MAGKFSMFFIQLTFSDYKNDKLFDMFKEILTSTHNDDNFNLA